MKKKYLQPEAEILAARDFGIICQSIDYGDGGAPGGPIDWEDDYVN